MTKPVTIPDSPEGEQMDSDIHWALLERVVASRQLKRATRLREFLLYVGQRAVKEGLDQIHEQEIGAKVFGRPADYDTSLDNIVRVNASELRKRIDDYFSSDGLSEAWVMEIPRGSYKPVFRQRAVQPRTQSSAPDETISRDSATKPRAIQPLEIPVPKRTNLDHPLFVAALAIIVALAAACLFLWKENQALRQSQGGTSLQNSPALNAFWSGILSAHAATDVVLADTSFALVEDIARKSIALPDYLSRNYVGRLQSPALSQDRKEDLEMIMQRNNGSLGDFRAAHRLLALDPQGKSFHLYSARDYTPALFKQDNLVLIGARKSNPWVDLFQNSLNFTAEYDLDKAYDYIRNKAPQAGEQGSYSSVASPGDGGYCVVAYLPNPEQSGKAIIIAGTDSAATEGGGDFLSSENQLAKFEAMLHVTTLPYFEVLLRTTNLNGTPIDEKILAYRVYPGAH